MTTSDHLSSRNQTVMEAGLAHVATIQRQPLDGLGSIIPPGVSPEEGYVASEAYEAATGATALGVGIMAALGAAAVVRAASDVTSTPPAPLAGLRPGLKEALRIVDAGLSAWGANARADDLRRGIEAAYLAGTGAGI